jgi:hypothetical protein
MMNRPGVRAAALFCVLGLPGLRYLTTRDEEERLMLQAVSQRALECYELFQKNLAVHIANAMVKAKLHG